MRVPGIPIGPYVMGGNAARASLLKTRHRGPKFSPLKLYQNVPLLIHCLPEPVQSPNALSKTS